MKSCSSILLLLSLLTPVSGMAQEEHQTAGDAVIAFHEALASGEKQRVLDLLDPDVTIFESGGAELSRNEYASHHLGADMEFTAAATRKIVAQEVGEDGDTAWVLTRSETSGTFRGKKFDSLGVETLLLKRDDQGWRIVPIHWSSRARKTPH